MFSFWILLNFFTNRACQIRYFLNKGNICFDGVKLTDKLIHTKQERQNVCFDMFLLKLKKYVNCIFGF